jgi:bromodomain-containing factor 1
MVGDFNLTTGSWWSGSKGKRQREAELAGQLWGAAATARNQTEDVPSVAGPSARRRRKRTARDSALSYEQKEDLCETIKTLHGQRLELVSKIIREGMHEIRDSQEDIIVDIDTLPESVLTKLYDFVTRPLRQPPVKLTNRAGEGDGVKRKRIDEDLRNGNSRTA